MQLQEQAACLCQARVFSRLAAGEQVVAVPWACSKRGTTTLPLTQLWVWLKPPGEVCKGEGRCEMVLLCCGLVLELLLLPLRMQP